MLAQSFMTAKELGISDKAHHWLIVTLGVLERGEVRHIEENENAYLGDYDPTDSNGSPPLFNMNRWMVMMDVGPDQECDSVCCIGGTAEWLARKNLFGGRRPKNLNELFYPGEHSERYIANWAAIRPEQAAQALRNYLTTGQPSWSDVLFGERD